MSAGHGSSLLSAVLLDAEKGMLNSQPRLCTCLFDSISVDFIHAFWGCAMKCVCIYEYRVFEWTPLQSQISLLVTVLILKQLCLAAKGSLTLAFRWAVFALVPFPSLHF